MSEVVTKELPENWVWTTLGEAFNWGSGGTPKRTNPAYYDGDIPWLIIRDLNDGPVGDSKTKINEEGLKNSSAKWVEPGSVLVAMYGSIGKLGLATERLTTNQAIAFTLPEPNNAKYLFYYLMLSRTSLAQQGKGIAQKNISQTVLKSFPFPLAPPEQQKRIVAKIEELFSHIDAGIKALNKAKQLLKQYRQSVLKAAVTGELSKEWREKNKDKLEPASQLLERILQTRRQKWEQQQLEQFKAKGKIPKDDKWKAKYKELTPCTIGELKGLPELPVGWTYTKLGNVIDEPKYGTSKKCSPDIDGKGVLRIPNIGNGKVKHENMKYAHFEESEHITYKLKEGDILTIRSNGSPSLVGKCALIRECDVKYLYAGYLIRLRPNKIIASSLYLMNSLNSIYLRQQIEFKAKSTSGVNNINSGELQSLIVSICNIEEQIEINSLVEEKLMAMHRLYDELELELVKADKNKQSILASAFVGKLSIN